MKRLFILLVLLAEPTFGSETWHLPPENWGRLHIPADENYSTAGQLSSTIAQGTRVGVFGRAGANLDYGGWQLKTTSFWLPNSATGEGEEFWQAVGNVYLKPGGFPLALTGAGATDYPTTAMWATQGYAVPPLFGLPQVSQKGNFYPYAADGKTTIAQNGCLLCSILAGAKRINRCPWSIEFYNDWLALNHGFNVRDIRCPIAANLVGFQYIGEFKWNIATIEKYHARDWHEVGKMGVKRRNGKWGTHFVGISPGVILPGKILGMMDPACRSDYFNQTRYRPRRIKVFAPVVPQDSASLVSIPYLWRQNGWWLGTPVYPPDWGTIASASENSSPDVSSRPAANQLAGATLASSGLARLDAFTNQNVFLERVETPRFILTPENSEEVAEGATLDTDFGSAPEDDDSLEIDEEDLLSEPPPDDHSVMGLLAAPQGRYIFFLSGPPNAPYQVTCWGMDNLGKPMADKILAGVLDASGKASTFVDFDPGITAFKLGTIRQMSVGSEVSFSSEVTETSATEFSVENADRSAGVKVLSLAEPSIGATVWTRGKVISLAPEIIVEATEVKILGSGLPTIKPLGIAGKWPTLANGLLAKIAGKVATVNGSTAIIDDGGEILTLTAVDKPLKTGDFVTLVTVLRANKILRPRPGSIQILD